VAILGRRKEAGDELAKAIRSSGGKAISVQADVLSKEQLIHARETVVKEFEDPYTGQCGGR